MSFSRSLVVLGAGTSMGVPVIGCQCHVCRSGHPRNQRTRPSVVVRTPGGTILVDTTPEVRLQLLREDVRLVHALLYTHYHVDHLYGLDDVRVFPKYLGGPLPIYCTADVEAAVREVFSYIFLPDYANLPLGMVPRLEFSRIDRETPFHVCGQRIVPVPLRHGRFDVLGFRFDDVAYCTDVNVIPDDSWKLLENLDVLILDSLRDGPPHPTHFNLEQSLDVIARLKPKQAYLTHMSHEMDYEAVSAKLPPGVALAYDGLRIEF